MSSLTRLDITGLGNAYRARAVTPGEVVAAHLDRIDRLNGHLKAYIDVDRDGARAAAAESAARLAAGTARPLEGVPVGIKSNIAVAGLGWNAGMELHRRRIAHADAPVVARLRAAGAIVLGTLNMHEAALGASTDNPWFGRALNPHGRGRTPGGSSGGSGAAVAAGLCVAALGTDTLGSIRIPAAYCGVYGLKPTHGALPVDGIEPLSRQLDAVGPLARSVDDLALMWAVLAGTPATEAMPARVVTLAGLGGVDCEPAVLAGYARALQLLPASGELTLPAPAHDIRTAGFAMMAAELSRHLGPDRESDLLSDLLRRLMDFGDSFPPRPELLAETAAAVRAAIGSDGVLLMPGCPQAAFVQGGEQPVSQADFTALANIAGLPALTLPAGRDADGMPVAVQLVGPPGGEGLLLAAARHLDAGLAGHAWPGAA